MRAMSEIEPTELLGLLRQAGGMWESDSKLSWTEIMVTLGIKTSPRGLQRAVCRTGVLDVPGGMVRCSHCRCVKPASEMIDTSLDHDTPPVCATCVHEIHGNEDFYEELRGPLWSVTLAMWVRWPEPERVVPRRRWGFARMMKNYYGAGA